VACIVTNVLVMLVEFSANGWRVEPLGINWSVGVSAETLVGMGAKVTSRIVWRREWWRLLTASWLHGGLFHLALNLALLWQLGAPLERAYGAWAVAPLYLISGVYGVVTSALLLPAVVSALTLTLTLTLTLSLTLTLTPTLTPALTPTPTLTLTLTQP
jgi:membrane associated rhomboid family serine protease